MAVVTFSHFFILENVYFIFIGNYIIVFIFIKLLSTRLNDVSSYMNILFNIVYIQCILYI